MINWVKEHKPAKVMLVTECSMSQNVAAEVPDVEFITLCKFCPHMKRITLPNILDSLLYLQEEVTVDPAIVEKARRSVERMINLTN
jgi:quinolinate synthase